MPKLLIIGTGQMGVMQVAPTVRDELADAGIDINNYQYTNQ